MKYDDLGREILDDTPIEVPLSFKRPATIQELIALHVRSQMQIERVMGVDNEEDFEEDVERDDILTPYELHAMAGEADVEMSRAKAARDAIQRLKGGHRERGAKEVAGKGAEASASAVGAASVGGEGAVASKAGSENSVDDRGGAKGVAGRVE